MAKDKVKQQAGKLQVFDPQDLFNRLISLALVLTSGGGEGLPISLTKIMGYELSQFPASLFETEYLMLATNKPQIIQMLILKQGGGQPNLTQFHTQISKSALA